MLVYVLRNGLNRQFIEAFDSESSAIAERNNLLKAGIYRKIDLETMSVKSDVVTTMSVVKVEGYLSAMGPKLTITPYTPAAGVTVVDKLTFNVTSKAVTFVGFANMTADEIASTDIKSLTNRLTGWIETQFATRIENDNPSDPEPTAADSGTTGSGDSGSGSSTGGDSGSGTTGGDSGSTGGDSSGGTTGGDSGTTGGDSGTTGGDSGGGDSGTTGGDSGSDGEG